MTMTLCHLGNERVVVLCLGVGSKIGRALGRLGRRATASFDGHVLRVKLYSRVQRYQCFLSILNIIH